MRLVNGSTTNQGRVEVLHQGAWTPLCAWSFGVRAAAIVCRQLGYVGGVATLQPADTFGGWPNGAAKGVYVGSDEACSDTSKTLHDCSGGFAITLSTCRMASVTCAATRGEDESTWLHAGAVQSPRRQPRMRPGSGLCHVESLRRCNPICLQLLPLSLCAWLEARPVPLAAWNISKTASGQL